MSVENKKKQKPKYNMWQNSGWMIATAWKVGEKKVLLLCILSAAFSVGGSLVNLLISPVILGAVERKAPVGELCLTVLIFTGLMMLTSAASAYIGQNTMYGRVYVRSYISHLIFQKHGETSYPNIENTEYSDMYSKAAQTTASNGESTEAVWQTLTSLLENILGFAIYLFLIASLNPVIIIAVLATTVSGYFLSRHLNGYEYRHRKESSRLQEQFDYTMCVPFFRPSAKDIRIFGLLPWIRELHEKNARAFYAFHARVQGVYIWARIADLVLAFLRNGIAYYFLIRMVVSGEIGTAEFLLFFSAMGGFTSWVSGILNGFSTLHKQSLELSIVREFLEYPEIFRFEEGAPLSPDTGGSYELKLENVSFRYPGAKSFTLKNINLTIRPGEKLAIVGLNGAGKTTLVKLICGFYDPTEGHVLLNGRDIREFNRRDYYLMFSAVFQQFHLLAASLAANVAQSLDDIDMERVRDCIAKAGLTEKAESLPHGYDTLMDREIYDDAVELSGGETQRLMLARAIYKNAPFIILDEPTAALDPIAEADMYSKYHEMTENHSSVYISHRLASTRFCDRILFLENSVIAEEGTHTELLSKKGRYAELFEVQSRYYREEEIQK